MKKLTSNENFQRAQSELTDPEFEAWLCFVHGYMSGRMTQSDLETMDKHIDGIKSRRELEK